MGVRAVFLTGFMGSGKNTVGQQLARRLSLEFVDLDSLIETLEGRSISDIFQIKSETYFRAAERNALRHLLHTLTRDTVIALGGGAFVPDLNRQMLRAFPTIFLDAPVEELWQRCLAHESADGTKRPLRGDREHFARLHEERLPFYRQASLTVNTHGKQVGQICEEIESGLQALSEPSTSQNSC